MGNVRKKQAGNSRRERRAAEKRRSPEGEEGKISGKMEN